MELLRTAEEVVHQAIEGFAQRQADAERLALAAETIAAATWTEQRGNSDDP